MRKFLGLIGVGAALSYFFHPEQGPRRRAMLMNKLAGMPGRAKALRESQGQPDDVTLARQVESEIFRDAEVPKGQINVNAENGKIVLRGEVGQPEMISDLEKRARSVQGVNEVENLLHLPGTEAPMHS